MSELDPQFPSIEIELVLVEDADDVVVVFEALVTEDVDESEDPQVPNPLWQLFKKKKLS